MIRKGLFIISPISLLLFLLVGCGGGSGTSSKKADLGEPNDEILKAEVTEPGRSIDMKIDSADDVDWYGIAVPSTGYIKTGVKNVPGDLDPEVRFARKQEWEDQKQKWISNWDDLPKSIRIAEADTIYMAVHEDHQDARSSKAFPLRIGFIEEFDEQEPNGGTDEAVSVKTGKPLEAYIYPVGDRERFKTKVDTAGYLRVSSKESPEGIEEEVRFGRKTQTEGVEWISSWDDLSHAVRVPEGGLYHLALQDDHNDGSSQDALQWKVDHLAEMDSTEPNASTSQAASVSIPDTLAFAIYPEGDRDFLELSVESEKTLLIKADAPDDMDLEMRVLRKKEMENEKVKGWDEVPRKISLKGAETYYLSFQDDHNDQAEAKPFPVFIREAEE